MADVRRLDGYTISSPCEPNGSGELKTKVQISCEETVQRLFFRFIVQQLFFLNILPLTILCGCTAQFLSDLVKNPEERFSHDVAHMG